jgi:hypothetical protein
MKGDFVFDLGLMDYLRSAVKADDSFWRIDPNQILVPGSHSYTITQDVNTAKNTRGADYHRWKVT